MTEFDWFIQLPNFIQYGTLGLLVALSVWLITKKETRVLGKQLLKKAHDLFIVLKKKRK